MSVLCIAERIVIRTTQRALSPMLLWTDASAASKFGSTTSSKVHPHSFYTLFDESINNVAAISLRNHHQPQLFVPFPSHSWPWI